MNHSESLQRRSESFPLKILPKFIFGYSEYTDQFSRKSLITREKMDKNYLNEIKWNASFVIPKTSLDWTEWTLKMYAYIFTNHFIRLKCVSDTQNTTVYYDANGDDYFPNYLALIGLTES